MSCRPARGALPELPLRVVSYNIAAGHGDLDAIADAIRALDADLVALQEVDVYWSERSQWQDQAALLGARLGLQVRFAPIYTVPSQERDAPSRAFGVALLSRHPIVAFSNRPLTRWSTLEPDTPPRPMPPPSRLP
jgi:endonuclease/exonuclease/phosphatase family metal-dependent hydrolase